MNWVTEKIAQWLIDNLTEEMVKEWANKVKLVAIPWARLNLDKLFVALEAGAKKTETKIDDKGIKALRWFVNAFLPDVPDTL